MYKIILYHIVIPKIPLFQKVILKILIPNLFSLYIILYVALIQVLFLLFFKFIHLHLLK